MDAEPPLLTVKEVAARLRMSPSWVREQAESGGLPAYQVGERWRFDPIELADWLTIRQNHTTSTAKPRRYASRPREAPDLSVPVGLDPATTISAAEVADEFDLPKTAVIGWLQEGLVPGYHAGRAWLMDRAVYDEVREILDKRGWPHGLPAGAYRTGNAKEGLQQEMLRRRGIGHTVRSWRYHYDSGPIYWVPGPTSEVRRRRASGPGGDDA